MIHKLEHIGVMVKDTDVSINFYTEILGMKLIERVMLNKEVELSFLSFPGSDDVQIELINKGSNEMPTQSVVNHIAFTVNNIEAEIDRLRKLEVQLLDETPRTILDGRKIAFFLGPDGERLELFQPKQTK